MQVYYFSRSGNCERIAKEIAKSHNIESYKIDDGKDWSGKASFIKAGAMSAKREVLPVTHHEIQQGVDIVLVFPIWAGTFPPAIRGFLNNVKNISVTAVAVSAISSLKEDEKQIFDAVYEVKGKLLEPPKELL